MTNQEKIEQMADRIQRVYATRECVHADFEKSGLYKDYNDFITLDNEFRLLSLQYTMLSLDLGNENLIEFAETDLSIQ